LAASAVASASTAAGTEPVRGAAPLATTCWLPLNAARTGSLPGYKGQRVIDHGPDDVRHP
jgi:hypothetical protein